LTTSIPVLSGIAGTLLAGYWILLRFFPVPGHGLPDRDVPLLDPERNLVAYVDRRVTGWLQQNLRTGSLYGYTHDPEGLLSTIPAVATALLGAVSVLWMQCHSCSPSRRRNRLLGSGLLLLAAGKLAERRLSVNKNLWTSSFVLLAGGISVLTLALRYHTADVKRLHKRSHYLRVLDWPWLVLGSNAITAYAFSVLLEKALSLRVSDDGRSLRSTVYHAVFARRESTPPRSLAYAASFAAICFLPNLFLWRKRIFVKI
jgi:predicted acyltransferase